MPWPLWPVCETTGACAAPGTDTSSSGPCWGKERQAVSVYVPLIIETEVSYNLGISAFVGNLVSSVQATGNGNTSHVLADQEP